MERVELRPAYAWDCPDCGRENFSRGVVLEPSEAEAAELREEHGVEPYDTGHWMLAPTEVTCPHCDETFSTREFDDEQPPD